MPQSLRFAPEVSARVNAACALDKSLSKAILMQSRLPRVVRVNVATAIQSALLYAAATWPQLSAPQRKKVRCSVLQSPPKGSGRALVT